MAWTEITRAQYWRDGLRYASDTTEAEWAACCLFSCLRHAGGAAARSRSAREVIDRDPLHSGDRLPVACAAEDLSAAAPLFSTISTLGATSAFGGGSISRWCVAPAWRQDATPFPPPASSTARASRPRKAVARAGLTPPSGSRDASATSSPTRRASCSPCWCTPPTSRTITARYRCSRRLRQTFPKLQHIFADRVYRGHKLRNALAAFGRWTIEIVTRIRACRHTSSPSPNAG